MDVHGVLCFRYSVVRPVCLACVWHALVDEVNLSLDPNSGLCTDESLPATQ